MLSALGRIGGKPALKVIEAALADKDPARSAAALRALCNWPDGSVAPRLVELALAAKDPADRKMRRRRLDSRRPAARQAAGRPAAGDAQAGHGVGLQRRAEDPGPEAGLGDPLAGNPALRGPVYGSARVYPGGLQTVVELAHHKALRQPNKAEFNKALDKVIALSKDPELLAGEAYQKDQTWVENRSKEESRARAGK